MEPEDIAEEVARLYDEAWQENECLEFKSAKGGIPAELWSSYSAFANTAGGFILLGVEDDGCISGVKDPQKTIDSLFVTQNNPQKCSTALCDNRHITPVTLDGQQVVAMYVPKAEPSVRPVFLRGNEVNSYLRRGSADIRCKKEDITRMRRNRDIAESLDFSLDSCILPNSSLQDLDPATLRKFRLRMQVTNLGMSLQDLEDISLLQKLGGYRVDRATGEKGITMAGMLMFGTSDALDYFFPHFQLDFFEYDDSTDVNRRWVDRITTDGTWSGNIYEFFFKVLPRLTQALRLPFQLDENLSRNESLPASIAVRETLANALIHADYYERFGIRVDQRPTGIVFTNPGSMLISSDQLFTDQQHPSICRNKGLQKMFQALGVVDKAGSGIDKIMKGWMEYCIALPQVQEQQNPERVTWELPYVSMIPRERLSEVSASIGNQAFAALDTINKLIMLSIPLHHTVGHKDISSLVPLHPADLSKRLAWLVGIGLLEPIGRGRGTKYRLAEAKASLTPPLMDTHNHPGARHQDELPKLFGQTTEPPSETRIYPASVQLVKDKRKAGKQEMRSAILDLCAGEWMSIQGIASILDRTKSTIRPHCEVLVAEKRLQLRYEDTNHPHQAYRTL